jgi:hypothetical protein
MTHLTRRGYSIMVYVDAVNPSTMNLFVYYKTFSSLKTCLRGVVRVVDALLLLLLPIVASIPRHR